MSHFIGATGLDIFDDAIETAIEETTITLTNLINTVATQDNLNAIYSSNYTDKVGVYSSNYSDKVGVWGSNYTDREITYTSNYVRTTSNILVNRIKLLEGSEGSAGDPSADPPIPPIPPTGNVAILATLALLGAGATATGILISDLTTKVNNNAIYGSNYSDKVGVWGSNYTDRVGIFGSNYTDRVGVWGSNYTDRVGVWGSNYTDRVGVWGSNYSDKVGVWGSNYTDRVGVFGSNYTDRVGVWGSNYTDKVGKYSSNYTDKVGIYSSNYTDRIGIFSSNYTDKVGIYSSNYTDKMCIYSSNYTDKVGIYSSNYTDKVGIYSSNYTERLIAGLGTNTNYWTTDGATNIYLNQAGNVGIGTQTSLTNKLQVQGTASVSGLLSVQGGITAGASSLITANNGIVVNTGSLTCVNDTFSKTYTATSATAGTSDISTMRYDTRNGIRFQQRYNGTDDVRYDIIQKVANVDKTASLTFFNGNVGIGRTDPTNIFQIGSGNKLRIANNNTDYTIIGAGEAPELYTRIIIYGVNSTDGYWGGTGNISYISGNGGKHMFFTQTTTTDTQRMIIANNGNVGIGTTNPLALLDVVYSPPAVANTDMLNIRVDGNWGLKLQQSYTGVGNIQYDFIHRYSAVNYNALTFKGANLGIGTTNPLAKLHVEGLIRSSSEIAVVNAAPWDHGRFWHDGGAFYMDAGGAENGIVFRIDGAGTGYPSNYTERMRINANGNLSVTGSFNAAGSIQASGAFYFANGLWHKSNDGLDRFHFSANSTTYIKSGNSANGQRFIEFRSGNDTTAAYIEWNYILYCYGPINLSDRRIKRDIVEINDDDALNKILLIQPTTYYYRDEARNRGNGKVYGFIAQQIKEVIPDAVHTTKDIIANIYKTCLVYNKREIYHSIPQDVAIDTEVRILDKEGGEKSKRYKIKEIYEDHFVIDEDIDGDDCFVFGYCVDDLNGLDKSYIYTLNVCATQELHRRIEAQKVIIQSQDDRIRELETKMVDILKYLSL